MAGTTQKRPAKEPISVLAGPYGHPMHPIFVTLPIGAWVLSFVFDLASRWSGEPEVFSKGAFWLIGLGVLGALVAAVFGFMDYLTIPRGTRAHRVALTHMALNLSVTALFAASFFLRREELDGPTSIPLIVLSVVALGLLGVSGWLGGTMSYKYGIRVADEETQAQAY